MSIIGRAKHDIGIILRWLWSSVVACDVNDCGIEMLFVLECLLCAVFDDGPMQSAALSRRRFSYQGLRAVTRISVQNFKSVLFWRTLFTALVA